MLLLALPVVVAIRATNVGQILSVMALAVADLRDLICLLAHRRLLVSG